MGSHSDAEARRTIAPRASACPSDSRRVLHGRRLHPPRRVVRIHVVVQDALELFGDVVAAQGYGVLAVHVYGRLGLLEGAGKGDPQVGVLRLAGAVHHAPHHRHLHLFHTRVAVAPHRHLVAQVALDVFGQLLARTEAIVRARLREAFPVGTTRFADTIDTDGHGNGPFTLRLALTRTPGDRFILDATETDDQAVGPVNLLMHPDVPGMALGLYFLQGEAGQVLNAGGPRAIDEVRLREGSLLWPRAPAPLGLRGITMMRLLAALHGLVAVARQGQAPAAHSAYVILALRGENAGKRFLMTDGVAVGYGGRPFADGVDAVYFVAQENYPVEFMELAYPVRLRRYAIHRDSGGPGRFRGGCGVVREYEVLCDAAQVAIRIDGVVNPPWGVAGGMAAGSGRAVVNPGTPGERVLPSLSDGTLLRRGDVLRLETGGGGGWGHPFDRPAEQVLADVVGGFVTVEAAERDYGVILGDDAATADRRAQRGLTRLFHRRGYVDAVA